MSIVATLNMFDQSNCSDRKSVITTVITYRYTVQNAVTNRKV